MSSIAMGGLELLLATFAASLLGSIHCVGMCGPFAVISTATAKEFKTTSDARRGFSLRLWSYHLGRLTTYSTLGAFAALVSWGFGRQLEVLSSYPFFNLGGMIGVLLLCIGVWRAIGQLPGLQKDAPKLDGDFEAPSKLPTHAQWMNRWSLQIAKLRKRLPRGSQGWNAYFWGLTSTLLPCGWLYLFLLTSLAAPNPWQSIAMMTAFWLGTLPLLSLTAWGWSRLGERMRGLSGPIATATILGMGLYLVTSRMWDSGDSWERGFHQLAIQREENLTYEVNANKRVLPGNADDRAIGESDQLQISTNHSTASFEQLRKLTFEMNDGLPCCEPGSDPANRSERR